MFAASRCTLVVGMPLASERALAPFVQVAAQVAFFTTENGAACDGQSSARAPWTPPRARTRGRTILTAPPRTPPGLRSHRANLRELEGELADWRAGQRDEHVPGRGLRCVVASRRAIAPPAGRRSDRRARSDESENAPLPPPSVRPFPRSLAFALDAPRASLNAPPLSNAILSAARAQGTSGTRCSTNPPR